MNLLLSFLAALGNKLDELSTLVSHTSPTACVAAWTRHHCSSQRCTIADARRQCRSTFPSWATPSTRAALLAMPRLLANRSLLLVGDSTMKQVWQAFVTGTGMRRLCPQSDFVLCGSSESEELTRSPLRIVKRDLLTCAEWPALAFSLCTVEAGRRGGERRVPRDASGSVDARACSNFTSTSIREFWEVHLGDALECFTSMQLVHPQDIVVVNVGVHHPNSGTLRDNVNGFLKWAGKVQSASANHGQPCILWRQTFPQHFSTPTGVYATAQAKSTSRAGGCCKPIEYHGDGGGNLRLGRPHSKINLEYQSQQKHNDVTNLIIKDTSIPSLHMYPVLEPLYWAHPGCDHPRENYADCTHWDRASGVNELLSELMLVEIVLHCAPAHP